MFDLRACFKETVNMCSKRNRRENPDHPNEILLGREGAFYRLETSIFLPYSASEVFAYFSEARNLETITPRWLRFRILTPLPISMHRGARILYRLSIHGVPINWETEITAWEPPGRFVDEQRRGPYRSWMHEHVFKESAGGCRMTDSVRYSVWGGRLVHSLFVKRDVLRIFRHRAAVLQKIFNPADADSERIPPDLAPC